MRQELIDLYAAMEIACAKHYVQGRTYFKMMAELEESMTRDEYVAAKTKVANHFGYEPIYK